MRFLFKSIKAVPEIELSSFVYLKFVSNFLTEKKSIPMLIRLLSFSKEIYSLFSNSKSKLSVGTKVNFPLFPKETLNWLLPNKYSKFSSSSILYCIKSKEILIFSFEVTISENKLFKVGINSSFNFFKSNLKEDMPSIASSKSNPDLEIILNKRFLNSSIVILNSLSESFKTK